MSAGKPYAMRVSVGSPVSATLRNPVESEAPPRVLETPREGSTRTTYATGSASRG